MSVRTLAEMLHAARLQAIRMGNTSRVLMAQPDVNWWVE